MHIEKINPQIFTNEYDIMCQRLFPHSNKLYDSPFGAMWGIIEPGEISKIHGHHEVETFIIFKGEGIVKVGKKEEPVTQGDAIFIPPFEEHSLKNTSDENLIFFTIWWENAFSKKNSKKLDSGKKKYLITATPPTPNGDLHVGHLSGPYTGADILTRYLKLKGNEVFYMSGADDHQSYVPFKAGQLEKSPRETADHFANEIEKTLRLAEINPDIFVKPHFSTFHIEFVKEFFEKLWNEGKLVEKEVDILFCKQCDKHLYEAYVRGNCPHCDELSDGNACEKCGRPNLCIDLLNPTCKCCGSEPEKSKIKQLFFPLSNYKTQLKQYYKELKIGPHLTALCERMLDEDLPDIPISHVSDWGIPVPVEGYENQTIYVWFEMAPGYLSATNELIQDKNLSYTLRDFWKNQDTTIINFFGYDNGYFHSVLFPAIWLAYSEDINLPKTMITNEFYQLEGLKFSTSRGHAVWGKELLENASHDVVRYYLSYSRPETVETNFTMEEFNHIVDTNLNQEWESWLHDLKCKLKAKFPNGAPELETLSGNYLMYYQHVNRIVNEIMNAYEPNTFSPQKVVRLLNELVRVAKKFSAGEEFLTVLKNNQQRRNTAIALELYTAKILALFSSPIMPTFGKMLWGDLGFNVDMQLDEEVSFLPAGQKVDLQENYFSKTNDSFYLQNI
ncbi:class I tRNA ligase family protein [Bacillus toyonensis]|uniref:class I tRNA ligase family protein n=1 Tax=Bacillus toyonensis TaxID=155322 RepID=UPI000BF09256|nr:class I tRNA ligase family protein [Bacillus toyonensis]PEN68713.1 methionine--tRNA ligase [Bacillus toyonensis]